MFKNSLKLHKKEPVNEYLFNILKFLFSIVIYIFINIEDELLLRMFKQKENTCVLTEELRDLRR